MVNAARTPSFSKQINRRYNTVKQGLLPFLGNLNFERRILPEALHGSNEGGRKQAKTQSALIIRHKFPHPTLHGARLVSSVTNCSKRECPRSHEVPLRLLDGCKGYLQSWLCGLRCSECETQADTGGWGCLTTFKGYALNNTNSGVLIRRIYQIKNNNLP